MKILLAGGGTGGHINPAIAIANTIKENIPDEYILSEFEINEEECLKHPYQPHTLRHYTGALTDIRPAKTEFYF